MIHLGPSFNPGKAQVVKVDKNVLLNHCPLTVFFSNGMRFEITENWNAFLNANGFKDNAAFIKFYNEEVAPSK